MAIYSTIFQFLLQLRRGKHLVDRLSLIKLSNSNTTGSSAYELKLYYTVRRKLAWIVSTLFEFFMAGVIQKEVDAFEIQIEGLTSGASKFLSCFFFCEDCSSKLQFLLPRSVQELVDHHETHVLRLRDHLLLQEKVCPLSTIRNRDRSIDCLTPSHLPTYQAAPIHHSIISLLDLCVSLSDTWTTFNVDLASPSVIGTNDPSRTVRSSSSRRLQKSRRHRRTRRSLEEDEEGSSSSSSEDEEGDPAATEEQGQGDRSANEETATMTTFGAGGPTGSVSFVSLVEEGFKERVQRIDKEVEEAIGFVRRGVQGLAKSAASRDGQEGFAILAGRLED